MYDLVIKNGRVVLPDGVIPADVCVDGECIAALLSPGKTPEGRTVIDAVGKLIFPGAIDTHVHLNDPGFTWREDYAHGTQAAAAGGVTTVIDMPLQNVPPLTDAARFCSKHEKVGANAWVDYSFWGGLVDYNLDQLAGLKESGCVAVKSFIGPVSPDYVSLNMGQVREALEILAPLGLRAGFHCEDYALIKWGEERIRRKNTLTWQDFLNSRPLIAEVMATRNVIDLARETGAKVHIVHVSHPEVAEIIREAQRSGVDVTGETCSHYLTFSAKEVLTQGSLYKCAPPLREVSAIEGLWEYALDGTLASICSDHSPCAPEEKSEEKHGIMGAWGGISGLQSLFQVIYHEAVVRRGFDPSLLARRLSEGPAKTFGLFPRKGIIQPGSDADLILVDPEREWEITPESLHYLNPISAFVGLKGFGLSILTIVRGQIVAEEGRITAPAPRGQLILPVAPGSHGRETGREVLS